MPTLFIKDGRIYIAIDEEMLDLVEEGWEPVARFKALPIALRAAKWYADRFGYIIEWG